MPQPVRVPERAAASARCQALCGAVRGMSVAANPPRRRQEGSSCLGFDNQLPTAFAAQLHPAGNLVSCHLSIRTVAGSRAGAAGADRVRPTPDSSPLSTCLPACLSVHISQSQSTEPGTLVPSRRTPPPSSSACRHALVQLLDIYRRRRLLALLRSASQRIVSSSTFASPAAKRLATQPNQTSRRLTHSPTDHSPPVHAPAALTPAHAAGRCRHRAAP